MDATPTTQSVLNFGALPVGARTVIAVPVQNVGIAPLTLRGAVAAAPFSVDTMPSDDIPSGAQGYVMVAYEPVASGQVNETLVLTTNSIDIPSLSVLLQGRAYTADLSADPARLDFGDVAVGSASTLSVQLTNPTQATLSPSAERAGSTDFAAAPLLEPRA